MEDLAGLGKIIDSKTAERVYGDAVARPAQEVGNLAADLLHVIGSPVRMLRTFTDRAEKLVKDAVKKVPADRQREAPAHVAGPILEKLRYCEDDSVFREMFLNLLTAAIDGEAQEEAHPEFADIIGAMSTSEAFFLWDLAQQRRIEAKVPEGASDAVRLVVEERMPAWKGNSLVESHIAHLRAFGLFDHTSLGTNPNDTFAIVTEAYDGRHTFSIWLTPFGDQFVRVCLPDKDPVAAARQSQTKSQRS